MKVAASQRGGKGAVRVGNDNDGSGSGSGCGDGIAFVDRQVSGHVRVPGEGDVHGSAVADSGRRGHQGREHAASQAKCFDGGADVCAQG